MKIRTIITVLIALTLNAGSATAIQTPSKVAVQQQSQIDFGQQLINIQKQKRLNKVVKYLTTKANKTAYVFSGSTTRGWDCSGLVVWTYKQMGVTLPHSANKQGHVGRRVSKPQVGDIVVFAYPNRTDFYHAAIYLGNNKIINANLMYGTTVIQPLKDFAKSQIRFVRVIND
jgi:cell wall-associated NlpC family hydrolase